MIYKRESVMAGVVTGDADVVVGGVPIPTGGRVLSVEGELHMIGAEGAAITKVSAYGFGGELVPVLDVEDQVDLNVLWDRMVPKAASVLIGTPGVSMDHDWDDAVITPQIEPGEVNVNQMMGLAEPTKEIIKPRMSYTSWAKNQGGWVGGTPDVYNPSDYKTFRGSRSLKAQTNSYGLLAVSSPLFDREATTESTIVFSNFAVLGNLRDMIKLALLAQIGVVEAANDLPFQLVSDVIGRTVSPNIIQPAAAVIITQTWNFFCRSVWICDSGQSTIPSTVEAF